MRAWTQIWLEHKAAGATLKHATLSSYRALLEQHVLPSLGQLRLDQITVAHVQQLCDDLLRSGRLSTAREGAPLGATSVRRVLQALGAALKHAVRTQILIRNVAELVQLPSAARVKRKVIDAEEAIMLIKAAQGTRLELVITIAVATGMRRGEILGLCWSDIDFGEKTARVRRQIVRGAQIDRPKSYAALRTVPLPLFVLDALRQHKADQNEVRLVMGNDFNSSGYVFIDEMGAPWNPDSISSLYRRITIGTGLSGLRFHDLRHSAGSILIAAGISIPVVSEILGHADPAVTMRVYAHALKNSQSAAADVMDKEVGGRQ